MTTCIFDAVVDFYGLQALEATARRRVDPFRRAHERWLEDFEGYCQRYIPKLAGALFDYLALASFGEARHCWDKASLVVEGLPRGKSRAGAYDVARRHDPADFLPKLVSLFEEAEWESGYGGPSWARIARAALLYGRLPDVAFVDHCVDLSHNNGLCFDKVEANIFCMNVFGNEYRLMLDRKAAWPPEEFLIAYSRYFSAGVWRLVYRAANLGLVNVDVEVLCSPRSCSTAPELLDYTPVEWGDGKLGEVVENGTECYVCGQVKYTVYEVQGEYVCSSCYDELYYCDYCGEKVLGDVTWLDSHGYVCDCCYETLVEEEGDESEEEDPGFEPGKYEYEAFEGGRCQAHNSNTQALP